MFFQPVPIPAYYDEFDEFDGIGSFFKKIGKIALPIAGAAVNIIPGVGQVASFAINAGISAGSSLLESGGGGGVAKGLAGINNYGNSVISALEQLKTQVASNPAAAVDKAGELAASLSDSSRVYPPKKGKDKTALDNFKAKAAALVEEIKAAAASVEQETQQIIQSAGGQIIKMPNGQYIAVPQQQAAGGGFDSSTLLIVGGVIVAAIFLTRS